jgi:hypothetical protein
VLESLAAGCPVLMSDQTPWRGLAASNAGWDLPLNQPRSFIQCVEALAGMDQEVLPLWRAAACSLGRKWAANGSAIEAHRQMFVSAASVDVAARGRSVSVGVGCR